MEAPQPVYTTVGAPTSPVIYVENNISSLCRLCGNVNDYLIPLFSGEGVEHELECKINKLLPVKVSIYDRLPDHICYSCASTIIAFYILLENCKEVEKKLSSFFISDINKEKKEIVGPNETYSVVGSSYLCDEIANCRSKSMASKQLSNNNCADNTDSRNTPDTSQKAHVDEPADKNGQPKDSKKQRKRKKRSISTCLICGKVFNFLEYLKTHLLIHSENRPHLCHICGATFKRKDHVNHHRRTVHITHRDVIRELGAKGEEPLTCEVCGDVKPTRHAMQVHKKKHSKVCLCDVCNKSFSLSSLLKEHMIKDHAEDLCTCSICGDVMKSGHSLYLHKKKHLTSYICDVCGKSFSLPSSLRTHMVVHSDEKPFTCEVCGKSFKLKGRLQLHKKNHENIRPYACSICENKRFKTKSALIVHSNMHNDTRLYPCPHCTFRARKNSDLVCHIRTHTGEKPYKCDICGRGFAQAGDMRKHRTTHDKQKM
ncbi:zinc finger protein 567-like [Cimex lectularius]|uniref:Zinc finger protein n=1 Tax=Cimex lectularius TaxID=79782 RepID=A0A8I6RTW4_CIMLE|nr:zinc finger protein 567-like [Cimex lectularius]